jgi:hypothetical protein
MEVCNPCLSRRKNPPIKTATLCALLRVCTELHRFFGHAVARATNTRGNGGPLNDSGSGLAMQKPSSHTGS